MKVRSQELRIKSFPPRRDPPLAEIKEYRIQETEDRIQNTGDRRQNTEYRRQNTEYRRQETEYRIQKEKSGIGKLHLYINYHLCLLCVFVVYEKKEYRRQN